VLMHDWPLSTHDYDEVSTVSPTVISEFRDVAKSSTWGGGGGGGGGGCRHVLTNIS
jgi:uncharacterized membrane protein